MPRSRFSLTPSARPRAPQPPSPDRLGQLRNTLLEQCIATGLLSRQLAELALREAEALACQTDIPLLVFPVLAEEKVLAVRRWQRRQDFLRRPTEQIAFAA
jgi:hypothetical protein